MQIPAKYLKKLTLDDVDSVVKQVCRCLVSEPVEIKMALVEVGLNRWLSPANGGEFFAKSFPLCFGGFLKNRQYKEYRQGEIDFSSPDYMKCLLLVLKVIGQGIAITNGACYASHHKPKEPIITKIGQYYFYNKE